MLVEKARFSVGVDAVPVAFGARLITAMDGDVGDGDPEDGWIWFDRVE